MTGPAPRRTWIIALIAAGVGLAAVVGTLLWHGSSSGPDAPGAPTEKGSRSRLHTLDAQPLAEVGRSDSGRPVSGVVRGVVKDDGGAPVAEVDVLVYASGLAEGPEFTCPGSTATGFFAAGCPEANDAFFAALDANQLEPTPLAAVRTNTLGEFSFELAGGPFDVWVQRKAEFSTQAEVSPGDEVELTLLPGAALRGKVTDGTVAIAGAEVIAAQVRPLKIYRTRADAQGRFAFPELPVASVQVGVAARAPDFLPTVVTLSIDEEEATVQLLRPGQLTGLVSFKGEPVRGAKVKVGGALEGLSDDHGHFAFARVACDPCSVTAELGDRFARQEVGLDEKRSAFARLVLHAVSDLTVRLVDRDTHAVLEGDLSASDLVEPPEVVEPGIFALKRVTRGRVELFASAAGHVSLRKAVEVGEGPSQIDLALDPELLLEGTVQGSDGKPLAEVSLASLSRTAGEGGAVTDENGHFEIHGLGAGDHKITLSHPLHLRQEEKVRLPAGAPLLITLRDAGRLSVEVLDPAGQPVADATVMLLEAGRDRPKFQTSNDLGTATFGPLSPGRYTVNASGPGWAPPLAAPEVEVSQGELRVRCTLRNGLTLSGRVVDDTGAPVDAVAVSAAPQKAGRAFLSADATTDPSGAFVIHGLEEGTYALVARQDDHDSASKEVRAGQEGVVIKLDRMGNVSGRVVRGGAPLPSFTVEGMPFESPAGEFLLPLSAGAHDVHLSGQFAPRTVRVEIAPGQTAALGDLAVDAGAALEGAVTSGGEPLGGIEVVATPGDDPAGEQRATTDVDGHFRIEDLGAGPHVVSGSGAVGIIKPQDVLIAAGRTTHVRLLAEAAGKLIGVVLDAAGDPVPYAQVAVRSRMSGGLAVADRLGDFTIEGLEPGTYSVHATYARARSPESTVSIQRLGETRVELRLGSQVGGTEPLQDDEP